MKIVSDTGPIIGLAKIGKIILLKNIAETIEPSIVFRLCCFAIIKISQKSRLPASGGLILPARLYFRRVQTKQKPP